MPLPNISSESKIDAKNITRPFQLLASWLVALIVLDSTFLIAASTIQKPQWASEILVISAIVNVPIFLIFMFLLQTRFRPEMQGDEYYSSYIQEQRQLNELSEKLKNQLNDVGLDLASLANGRSLDEAPLEVQISVKNILGEISGGLERLNSKQRAMAYGLSQNTFLEVSKAMMAEHKWEEAAKYLDEYVEINPNDWEAQRSRGIAHAMSRKGRTGDMAALNAYNQAIASVPRETDINTRARLYNYRGAMFKRLGRFQEALSDLKLAMEKASDEMIIRDIDYNLACVYSLIGKTDLALSHAKKLKDAPREIGLLKRHLDDYFKSISNNKEFLNIIKENKQLDY